MEQAASLLGGGVESGEQVLLEGGDGWAHVDYGQAKAPFYPLAAGPGGHQ